MNHFENFNQIQELDTESNTPVKAHNSYPNLTINLKSLDENENLIKSEKENNLNIENEDSFSYSALYRSSQNSFNKNSKDIELSNKKGFSNISTSQSDSTYQDINGYSPDIKFSQKIYKGIPPKFLFEFETENSLINYFQESEKYFRNIYRNKIDYQKTKNYIEKEVYYNYFINNRENMLNKTLDFSEHKNQINDNNTNNNKSLNTEVSTNNEEKLSTKIINPIIDDKEEIKNNSYNNIKNNYIMNQIYINPNINFNNITGTKFDVSMYYLGYYSVDCK